MPTQSNQKKPKAVKGASQSEAIESKPSISEKIAKLNTYIEWFYGDDFVLDQATKKYQDATALAHEILGDLERLKNKIKLINQDFS